MRVTIVGAGATGGTAGAYLARSGTAVEMVDKDTAHVAVMADKGLAIQALDEISLTGVQEVREVIEHGWSVK